MTSSRDRCPEVQRTVAKFRSILEEQRSLWPSKDAGQGMEPWDAARARGATNRCHCCHAENTSKDDRASKEVAANAGPPNHLSYVIEQRKGIDNIHTIAWM